MTEGIIVKETARGRGVFATRNFRKGQVICELQGKKLPKGRILVEHRSKSLMHIEQAYTDPLQIGPKHYFALKPPYLYFNHSCDPNAGLRGVKTLFALRPIEAGVEIRFDYSTTMDELLVCRCGAKHCRGTAADFFALPRAVQVRYARAGALPGFILRKYRRLITRK